MNQATSGAFFAIAKGDNRRNQNGQLPSRAIGRTSQPIASLCPAGGTIQYPAAGSSFYVRACSAPFQIRPQGGAFNTYSTGLGLDLEQGNSFDMIEVFNPNSSPVAYYIFVGFDGLIDKRLIQLDQTFKQVLYSTYDGVNSPAALVNIPDLSGSAFLDANGNPQIAIQRTALQIFNSSSGLTLNLLNAAGTTVCALIIPSTGITLPISGSYQLNGLGSNLACVVSEVYSAMTPGSLQTV